MSVRLLWPGREHKLAGDDAPPQPTLWRLSVVLFDDGVRPDLAHWGVLNDQLASLLDENY